MAHFSNWSNVEQALAKIMSTEADGAWVLVHYTDASSAQPHTIGLLAAGSGGVEEMKAHMDDGAFCYGLIRLANSKELQHSHKTTFRDVFFAFQGQKLSIMKRGRLVEHLGAVQAKFEPNHAQLIVKNLAALSRDSLMERSDPKAGSHIIE